MRSKCPKGHTKSWECCQTPPNVCSKCDAEARKAQEDLQRAMKIQEKRDREEKEHANYIAKLDAMLADERQRVRDKQLSQERSRVIEQKELDLDRARKMTLSPSHSWKSSQSHLADTVEGTPAPLKRSGQASQEPTIRPKKDASMPNTKSQDLIDSNWKACRESPARQDWEQQKRIENVKNDAIDSVMEMIGLEEVKTQILIIKAKIDASVRQNADIKQDRLNVAFLGNPGTGKSHRIGHIEEMLSVCSMMIGKTTVARLYAKILTSLGAIPGDTFVETTGSRLANKGVTGIKKVMEDTLKAGGGAIFLDEAYQLTDQHNYGGKQVLDFLLAEMENNVGKVVFIFAGYNKEMEKFFEHNPGLPSRVPFTFQ